MMIVTEDKVEPELPVGFEVYYMGQLPSFLPFSYEHCWGVYPIPPKAGSSENFTHVARDHCYEYVLQHPTVTHSERLSEKAAVVLDAMGDLYQAIGSEAHKFNMEKEK